MRLRSFSSTRLNAKKYDALYDSIRDGHNAFEKGLMKGSHDPQAIDNVLAEKIRKLRQGFISENQS
jgi:hypothetical protein